jgi:hypothetical protein
MAERHALTILAGLAAALPVIVAGARALANGWLPVADQGTIATRAYDVFTSHSPLVGLYSMASEAAGHRIYDPGPMLFWLLALPARFGGPAALTLTMTAFNTAAILASVALARRIGGRALMFSAATAIALMSHSLGTEALHGIWNPAAGLFALLLLSFTCWSLACGERWLLPLAVLVGSFVVQCHLAYVAPVLGLIGVGVIGLLISRVRRESDGVGRAGRVRQRLGALRGPALAGLVVALICWSAPIVDEIKHSPGNLSELASATGTRGETEGASVGWRVLVRAVGAPPRWLREPERQVHDPSGREVGDLSGGDYGDTRLGDVWTAPSALGAVSALLVLGALAAITFAAACVRRRDVVAGGIIGAALCASLAGLASATPVRGVHSLGYTLWWGSLVGMWVWLLLLWSSAVLASAWATGRAQRWPSGPSAALTRVAGRWWPLGAAGALTAGALFVAAAERTDAHQPEFRPLRAIATHLDRAISRGSTVLLTQRGLAALPLEPLVRYSLRRRGVHVAGYERGMRVGPSYELGRHLYDLEVEVTEAQKPAIRRATVLARVTIEAAPWLPGTDASRVITVSAARPGWAPGLVGLEGGGDAHARVHRPTLADGLVGVRERTAR